MIGPPRPLLSLALLFAVAFAGCVASPEPAAERVGDDVEPDHVVAMIDHAFEPPSLLIRVGDHVRFDNTGDHPHDAVARDGSWSSRVLRSGEGETLVFTREGTFEYYCKLHPRMRATLVVEEPGTRNAATSVHF